MLFIVIGRFRRSSRPFRSTSPGEAATPVSGLTLVGSWVEVSLRRCFLVIDCDVPATLQQWAARWRHCVDLEAVPIVPAPDAIATLQPLLE